MAMLSLGGSLEAAKASPTCTAHRGYWAGEPKRRENAIESVLAAHRLGADGCEVDVRLLGDRKPVLFHDRDINGVGLSSLDTAAFRNQLGVEAGFEVEELLRVVPADFPLLLDLKETGEPFFEAVAAVVEAGRSQRKRLELQSHSIPFLERLRERFPGHPCYWVSSIDYQGARRKPPSATKLAEPLVEAGVRGITAKGRRFVDEAFIEAFQSLGLHYRVWTINPIDRMLHYAALGVDDLITDRPDLWLSRADQASPAEESEGVPS